MQNQKRSIHAKKFVRDLRAGKTREELMEAHGLSPRSLEKLLRLLVEKQLIDPSEVNIGMRWALPPPETFRAAAPPHEAQHVEPPFERIEREQGKGKFPLCPQCGAQVSSRALTCPECGHVLPGEERWESVEPKRTFVERMSPKLLGIVIALPLAILVAYVFKDIILPMSEATVEKRVDAIRKEMPAGRSPRGTAREMARLAQSRVVELEVERLKTAGIISEAETDHSAFFVGPFWEQLPVEERIRVLNGLRAVMVQSSMYPNFQLMDSHRRVVAAVTGRSITVGSGDAAQTHEVPDSEPEAPQGPQGPQDPQDQVRRLLERRR